MAQLSESNRDEFRFTWKIENFSMCGHAPGLTLQSPSFTVGTLEKTEWHLKLYPRGKSNDFLICDLVRENDSGPSSVTMDSQFSLIITGGLPRFETKDHSEEYIKQGSSSHKLKTRTSLLKKKYLFLPKDTLTVECDLRQKAYQTIPITPAVKALVNTVYGEMTDTQISKLSDDVYAMAGKEVLELKRNLYPYNNECVALTRIGVERRTFMWHIKNFSSIKPNEFTTVPLPCSSKRIPPLIVTMRLENDNENLGIQIQKMAKSDHESLYAVCKIAVLDIDGREHFQSEKDYRFASPTKDETWQFTSFLTRKKLLQDKCLCLPNDVLSLRFKFAFSTGEELSQIEEYNFVTLSAQSSTDVMDIGSVSEDLRAFYANAAGHDVVLQTEEKIISAHKSILAFRSPVFCAMFGHDTEEKQTGVVDIPDINFKTLQMMIDFMYTDSVNFVHFDNARKLYIAADKYQVVALRKKCSSYLISNISQKNVFDILTLAQMHSDKELLSSVCEYIFKPPYDCFFCPEFESFLVSKTVSAAEMLRIWIERLKSEIALEF